MQPDEHYMYDHDSALIYYNKALQFGGIKAYAKIAWVYESLGDETNKLTTYDWVAYEDTAVYYYRLGAYAGDPEAQVYLARKLTAQGTSVLTEPDTAFYWATQAYKAGHVEAPATLGYLYRKGFGVEQDAKKAEMYFREAIEWGDGGARIDLGMMLRDGEGTPKNYVEGTRLFVEAMHDDDLRAVLALKQIATWVDAPQVEQQTNSNVLLQAFEWDKQGVLRVYLQWHNKQYPDGWMQIDSSAYIYDIQSNTRYTVNRVINCTFSPAYTSVPLGTKHQFGLVFEGVPDTISCINLCESDTSQWKFFGVHLEEKTHIVTLDEYFFKDVLDDL
jgi:TPR repeat protein